ncbi:MAG: hypothetical protein ACXVZQ_04045 [Terriglobales bacterium]
MDNVLVDEVNRKDAAEIETCFASGAWKAAYVLAGSALERNLVAHFLTRTGLVQARASMTLPDLIDACREDQRLVKHEPEIAEILRGYRNMIQPHFAANFEPHATRSTAAHAMAVLKKIISIIAANVPQPQQSQTAESIAFVAIESDIDDIKLHQLILAADPSEVKRLLLNVIPERACTLLSRDGALFTDPMVRLRSLFDLAFCFADEDIKRAVVKAFMAVLEEQHPKLLVIGTALFRPKYLLYFDGAERKRMLLHLLARLQNEMSLPALQLVDGLEEFLLDSEDLLAWLRTVVIACLAAPAETASAIRDYAKRAYGALSQEQRRIIDDKQAAVIRDCEGEGKHGLGRLLLRLQDDWAVQSANPAKAGVG